MKLSPENAIERKVAKWIRAQAKDRKGPTVSYDMREVVRELMEHGCQGGGVSEMLYYRDTLKFFARHKAEINAMLVQACEDTGCDPGMLLRDFDRDDPLAFGQANQNLLAWFAWETAARNLAERAGIGL